MNSKIIGLIVFAALLIGGGLIFSQSKKTNGEVAGSSSNSGITLKVSQDIMKKNSTSIKSSGSKKQYSSFPGILSDSELQNKKAVIETNKGVIEFEIFPEAPKAASNFIHLSKDGFYNSLTFHRVVPGFVIQGGDPLGTGAGGPGYQFEDEPVSRKYTKGIVAMANAGPNTNGSQFFIMLGDNDLPPSYTIFGQVLKGQDVVDKIEVGDIMQKVTIVDKE